MNREKAEKLLAALLFDDLDASSKAELTAYLQTDDELRERLTDMRMAVKITADALQHGPEPVLDEKRLKHLSKLAQRSNKRPTVFTIRYMAAAAAVVAAIMLPALFFFMPSLNKAKSRVSSQKYSTLMSERSDFSSGKEYAMDISVGSGIAYGVDGQLEKTTGALADPDSDGVKDPMVDISNSVQSIEESQESEKLYAKALRRENTSGGVGGEYGGGGMGRYGGGGYAVGGYGGGGYGGNGRRGTHLAFDSNADEKVVAQSMIGDNDEVFDAFSIVQDRPAERSYYCNASVDAPQGDEGSSTVVAGDSSGRTVNGYTVNSQSNFDLETDAVDFFEGVISAGDELARNVESPRSTETGGKVPDIQTGTGLAPSSATTKPAPATQTPPPPKKPAAPTEPVSGEWGGIAGVSPKLEQKAEIVDEMPQGVSREGLEPSPREYNVLISDSSSARGPTGQTGDTGIPEAIEKAHDGDVIVVGKAKVPILADVPVKSCLFKSEDKERFADGELKAAEKTQMEVDRLSKDIREGERMKGQPANIPYSDEIIYPKNWKEIAERRDAAVKEPLPVDSLAAGTVPESEVKKRLEDAEAMGRRSSDIGSSDGKDNQNADVRAEPGTVHVKLDFLGVDDFDARVGEDEFNLPLASRFKSVPVNPWIMTERDALSTFALDVDTASYTLSRRYISSGYLPPAGAVRMEEFINYFNYQYPQQSDRTFRVYAEAAASPFAGEGKNLTLLKIGVKARTLGRDQQKPAHLVFVIDTSASMGQPERLPLIQQALNLLLDSLTPADRVTLITCSDQARLLLDTVPVSQHERIRQVINAVQPAGTTNLLAGLQLGYTTARRAYSARQINQIVLCSDGVANVGQTEAEAVLKAVAQDRKQGITMTCVGVGYGTYNDAFMESLADQGDGSYVFLDSLRQAQRVFVEQLAATLHTVAKDARIQASFNPERVRRYRLIGYENRDIEDARFRDDTIDAGEVGSGQCSTALYELELINGLSTSQFDDFGTVFVRYRNVDTNQIEEISCDLDNTIVRTRTVEDSPYFYLAATAAQFAEILRQSEHVQGSNLTDVLTVAEKVSRVLGLDYDVRELAELIRRSENLPRAQ